MSGDRTRSFAWQTEGAAARRILAFWDGGSTERVLANGAELVLGRSEECDLHVVHDSVSRRHVSFRGGPTVTVQDLGSSNGTRFRGRMLAPHTPVEMSPGEIVEVGAALVMLQDSTSAEAPRANATGNTLDRSIDLAAKSSLSIVLYGETGVGKEVLAERIHARSSRARGPLVKINCAALPESLLESELFGYERGAFTGASQAKTGLIEAADTGTLFLDEIGEMPLALQAKLLRVLEAREVQRLGSLKPVPVDMRLVCATHRDLPRAVSEGAFRSDLFFRIDGATFRIPPLRERPHEILPLATRFLAEAASRASVSAPPLTERARVALMRHAWPGNVRELKNVVERALVFASGQPIEPEHLQLLDPRHLSGAPPSGGGLWDETHERERARIVAALESTHGNQTAAAKLLGIARRTLINRMKQYGLDRPR